MDDYHNHARLRVIGDVHGQRTKYLKLVEQANEQDLYTLQVGDLGFAYEYNRLLDDDKFDRSMNKMFMGNHDCYTMQGDLERAGFCLGDYGAKTLNGVSFFFVRGAFSIDAKFRSIGVDWFPEEELPQSRFQEVIDAYLACKPDIMVTHDCPDSVGHDGVLKRDYVLEEFGFEPSTFTTNTQVLLQQLFNLHKPKQWFFGHYHQNWTEEVNGTTFRCLAELSYVDV